MVSPFFGVAPLTNAGLPSPLALVECRRCGRNNSTNARFCPDCGGALDSAPPEPAAGRSVLRTLASLEDDAAGPRATDAGLPRPASMRPLAPDLNLSTRELRCPECGAKNPAQSLYCAACGHGVSTARPPAPDVPPAISPLALPPQAGWVAGMSPLSPRGEAVQPAASDGVRSAQLAVITQDGLTGDVYRLDRECVDIGREEGEIRLGSDRTVCPRHARIVRRAGSHYLQDLGSVNGVYLRLRQPAALQDGDLVLLGAEVLRFRLVNHAEQGLQPAVERDTEVYGSPKLPRYACLYERTVEGVSRNVLYITRNETVIGRESGDIVFTADSFMSRRHAAIRRDPVSGQFTLRDLGSSNGTFLAIRGEVPLADGEHVRVGQHLFRFGFGL